MASISIRNLVSHVASILYANFRAVTEKWQTPKLLPKGCHSILHLILTTTGSHVHLYYLLTCNDDTDIHLLKENATKKKDYRQ